MKLAEILDKPLPFKFTLKTGKFRASFMAGEREIIFEAENEEVLYGEADNGEWSILFGQKRRGRSRPGNDGLQFDLTGGGNEFEIFATLKTIIVKFIEKCSPRVINFSADKREPSRVTIYQKMFSRNLPAGWKLQKDNDLNDHNVYFQIIKKELP